VLQGGAGRGLFQAAQRQARGARGRAEDGRGADEEAQEGGLGSTQGWSALQVGCGFDL
jgi:hypothetical protein